MDHHRSCTMPPQIQHPNRCILRQPRAPAPDDDGDSKSFPFESISDTARSQATDIAASTSAGRPDKFDEQTFIIVDDEPEVCSLLLD
jgi:hypothetical protein